MYELLGGTPGRQQRVFFTVGVATIAVILIAVLAGVVSSRIPASDPRLALTVESTDVGPGVKSGTRVTLRGVPVGEVEAVDGVTGRYPKFEDFNLDGLDIDEAVWAKLFAIDPDAWAAEMDDTEEYFSQFGDKLPAAITEQLAKFRERIAKALGIRPGQLDF